MTAVVVPDSIEPVLGWKSLDLGHDGLLYSPSWPLQWTPYERMTASCGMGRCEDSLDELCTCGIYLAAQLGMALDYFDPQSVIVEVAGWGRVVPHERGYRVQYAYPTRIINMAQLGAGEVTEAQTDAVASAYGIPAAHWDQDETPKVLLSARPERWDLRDAHGTTFATVFVPANNAIMVNLCLLELEIPYDSVLSLHGPRGLVFPIHRHRHVDHAEMLTFTLFWAGGPLLPLPPLKPDPGKP